MLIHDEFGNPYDKKFRKKIYNTIKTENFSLNKRETPFCKRVYPEVFFGRDDYSNLMQVADIIATSLNYSYRSLKKGVERENLGYLKDKVEELQDQNDYLKIYWDLFVKDSTGNVNNWGIKLWV